MIKKIFRNYVLYTVFILIGFIVGLSFTILVIRQNSDVTIQSNSIAADLNEEASPLILQEYESDSENQHPPVASNEDFQRGGTHFTFSPNKKIIAFVEDVFEEYGEDWDKYWALKLFNPEENTERTLFVDDTKISSYEWLSDETIRVFHNGGTGVRIYVDIFVNKMEPIFSKDFWEDTSFWTPDEEFVQKARDLQRAQMIYYDAVRK